MKTIRISSLIKQDCYKNDFVNSYLRQTFLEYSFEFVSDFINNKCDIIIYDSDLDFENIDNVFENINYDPIYIFFHEEHPNWPYNNLSYVNLDIFKKWIVHNKITCYTISYFEDSKTNLYWPNYLSFERIYDSIKDRQNHKLILDNKKFATWISSNPINYRKNIVDYININYRHIEYFGNTYYGNDKENKAKSLGNSFDIYDSQKIRYNLHKNYKFNIAIENTFTKNNVKYITEKIEIGYVDNVIPIYYGCSNIIEIFNENSFINLNNLTYDEMINKIKEIDNNNSLYKDMFYEYPFKDKSINYIEYFNNKKFNFFKEILSQI